MTQHFPQNLVVLSSVKLHILNFDTKKSISFMKMLNNKGPRIDTFGTTTH